MDQVSLPFLNGTNNFTFEQQVFNPPKPIQQVYFQLWFVNSSGIVQFDNMTLQEQQIPQAQLSCAYPLVYNPAAGACAIPCPIPVNITFKIILKLKICFQIFGYTVMNAEFLMNEILSWISFFSSIWLIITW